MKRKFRIVPLAMSLLAFAAVGEEISISPEFLANASTKIDAKEYDAAISLLQAATDSDPACAECARLLGRAYGRLAQESSWVRAVKLAKKSRRSFEHAVSLEPNNIQAMEDLAKYYRSAPSFLGGDAEKAKQLEEKARSLRENGLTS